MHGLTPPVRLTTTTLILCIFSSGMAIGVFIALSFLLFTQVNNPNGKFFSSIIN